jgi:HK97 family phage major capsid protein
MPERICRYIEVDRAKIDRAARTVPLVFSSEFPALQRADENVSAAIKRAAGLSEGDIYVEVLDHEPENVDLSLLNNRGAFLDEHDEKDQIGVVERAEISEKQGRAIVKLDTHAKAETRLGQMEGNSRPHISAGYKYTKFLRSETLPNGRQAKRFAWKALELSSVAIPADPTIGVARAFKDLPAVDSPEETNVEEIASKLTAEQKKRMKILLDPSPAAGGDGTAVIDEVQVRADERGKTRTLTLTEERTRISEITVIADALVKDHGQKDAGKLGTKIRSMANEAVTKGEAVNDFKMRCMTDVLNAKPATPVLIADCTDDPSQYSILRGIQSCLSRKSNVPDGREGEVHEEVIRRAKTFGGLGYEAEGFQVPCDAGVRMGRSLGGRKQRDMQATVFAQGGAFVPTQLMTPIIEILRNMMVLDRVGIRTMAGLQGNIVIPRQEAAATALSVPEIGALVDSQQILGQIALNPKRVGASQTYSKQFVMQSSPDAEAFLRDDLLKVIALDWDRLGLNGQGAASEPLGIINTPGIASILFGATPTYIKLIAMRTALRKANVYDSLSFVSTPATEGSLSGVAEALTGATTVGGAQNAIWKPGSDQVEGRMVGCPAIASNQVPNDAVILGAFIHLIHAIWGGLDIVVDQFTKAKNAETVIVINTWGDFAVRHPQAFCVSADSGAQ